MPFYIPNFCTENPHLSLIFDILDTGTQFALLNFDWAYFTGSFNES